MQANAEKIVWNEVPVPQTNTSVYEALLHRRMAWKWQDKPVPREALERMLATSIWGPNHKQTEPWRYFVTTRESAQRRKISEFAKDAALKRDPQNTLLADRLSQWVMNQPVLMFAFSVPGPNEEVTRENYAAVVAGLQNVNLAGVAEGLTVTWETGGVAKLAGLAEAVGAEPDWQLVAMVTIGYGDEESQSSRSPLSNFVRWYE